MKCSAAQKAFDQTVLFSHPRGDRVRWMARTAIAIGVLVAGLAVAIVVRASSTHGWEALSPTLLSIAALLALSGLGFVAVSCHFARQFVVHLEIWPRSCLAVVRTAGCYRESINLVGWNEFREADVLSSADDKRDPWLRVNLRSGRRLILDHADGKAPQGWVALHRFLEKCSVPEPQAHTEEDNDSIGNRAARPKNPLSRFDSLNA